MPEGLPSTAVSSAGASQPRVPHAWSLCWVPLPSTPTLPIVPQQTPKPLRLSLSGHTHSHQALQTQELIINRAEAGDPAVGGAGQRRAGSQQSSAWGGFMGCHHGAPADSKHTDTDRWRVETLKAQPTVPKAFPEASSASSPRQGSPWTTPLAKLRQEGGQALGAQPWKCRVALSWVCRAKSVQPPHPLPCSTYGTRVLVIRPIPTQF